MLHKFVFRIILAAFGFILVPTNYWHSCEKPHNEHSGHQASLDSQHQTCSICDFDLFQLDQAEYFSIKNQRASLPSFSAGNTSPCQSKAPGYFNKGPPAVTA
ncbi:MAG: hypothetical protein K0R65_694 [Crocinitomicaceae bacterium]|nr:hypothetical protein [Crocinitomicaceae bacterium]